VFLAEAVSLCSSVELGAVDGLLNLKLLRPQKKISLSTLTGRRLARRESFRVRSDHHLKRGVSGRERG